MLTPTSFATISTESLIPPSDPMSRGILDTSTLILLGRLQDTSALPDEPQITAITLAELSVGPLLASTDTERSHLRLTS